MTNSGMIPASPGPATSLSIVTVCFDDDDGVNMTLESVLGQMRSGLNLQVIVVDGSQSAGTAEIFGRFQERFEGDCLLVSEPDNGVYDAMNKGTKLANGEFIQYLNSGDIYMNNRSLQILERNLESNPDWLVAGAYHALGTGQAQVKIDSIPFRKYRHRYGMQSHCHQACWFRTSLVRELDYYRLDVGFVADFDLIMQFAIHSLPVAINDDLILYQGGGMSASSGSDIPRLIGAVRRDRLYGGNLASLMGDRVFVFLQSNRRRLSHLLRSAVRRVVERR